MQSFAVAVAKFSSKALVLAKSVLHGTFVGETHLRAGGRRLRRRGGAAERGAALSCVFADLAVNRDGYIFLGAEVAELDYFATGARQLAPVAGLFGILLDRPIFAAVHEEACCAEALGSGAPDRRDAVLDLNLIGIQELGGDRGENLVIEHLFFQSRRE
jgi:hypothetical protein